MSIYRLKGASGAVINQSYRIGVSNVVGSAEDCDLRIRNEAVAPRHAEIIEQDGRLSIVNLSPPAETLVNGEPVDRAALASGDEIRIANCRWVLQAPGLRPEKVLTGEALQPRRSYLPWLIVAGLLAAAGLAWQQGWLSF